VAGLVQVVDRAALAAQQYRVFARTFLGNLPGLLAASALADQIAAALERSRQDQLLGGRGSVRHDRSAQVARECR
jgi:hypothetical protein